MKMLLTFGLAGAIALTTSAQTAAFAQSDVNSAFDVFRLSVESRSGLAPVETPSMRDAKLARAQDLKMEAVQLLQQDGGTLTPAHDAYIRGKVCSILGNDRARIGSLVPRRRC
jgi:hypothetical protein